MSPEEILDKLRPTLRHEGFEVDYLGREGAVVNIRAKRVAPGVPVAFLVKAVAGTYRRYLPEIEDVCLLEYDPGEGIGISASDTFEPVLSHRHPSSSLILAGLPVVDLEGLSRRDAVRSLESFVKMWGPRSPIVGLLGMDDDAPQRAASKWAQVYREDYRELIEVSPQRWEIVFAPEQVEEIASLRKRGDEVMPGKIFLTSEDAVDHER